MAMYRYPYFKGILEGDVERARTLRGYAESQLNILNNQIKFQGLKQGYREIIPDDHTLIRVSINHTIREIRIWCKPVVVVEKEDKEEKHCFCSCCMAEAEVVRIGGTERNEEGEITFQGDYDFGNPKLRYDLDVCYKKTKTIYEFYRVENVRPSDFTHWQVGSQGIVLFLHEDIIGKCISCDDCGGGDPEGIDTGCDKFNTETDDINDLLLLPISFAHTESTDLYQPALVTSTTKLEDACISFATITDITYPMGGSNVDNYNKATVTTDTDGGVFGNFTSLCAYNGISPTYLPACAFRKEDKVIALHIPKLDESGETDHYIIAHNNDSPHWLINGSARRVPHDAVFYTAFSWPYQDGDGNDRVVVLDLLRGEAPVIYSPVTDAPMTQPMLLSEFNSWKSWYQRQALTVDDEESTGGAVQSKFINMLSDGGHDSSACFGISAGFATLQNPISWTDDSGDPRGIYPTVLNVFSPGDDGVTDNGLIYYNSGPYNAQLLLLETGVNAPFTITEFPYSYSQPTSESTYRSYVELSPGSHSGRPKFEIRLHSISIDGPQDFYQDSTGSDFKEGMLGLDFFDVYGSNPEQQCKAFEHTVVAEFNSFGWGDTGDGTTIIKTDTPPIQTTTFEHGTDTITKTTKDNFWSSTCPYNFKDYQTTWENVTHYYDVFHFLNSGRGHEWNLSLDFHEYQEYNITTQTGSSIRRCEIDGAFAGYINIGQKNYCNINVAHDFSYLFICDSITTWPDTAEFRKGLDTFSLFFGLKDSLYSLTDLYMDGMSTSLSLVSFTASNIREVNSPRIEVTEKRDDDYYQSGDMMAVTTAGNTYLSTYSFLKNNTDRQALIDGDRLETEKFEFVGLCQDEPGPTITFH